MGRYTNQVHVYALVIIIICTFFTTLQARNLHDHPLVHVHVDSKNLLHKLGIHTSYHKQIKDAGDRLSPGGPDPQHNGKSPPSK
ncbi:unnamed protein product [Lathyrus oleraceus]